MVLINYVKLCIILSKVRTILYEDRNGISVKKVAFVAVLKYFAKLMIQSIGDPVQGG
jgi:hypothetical protein